MWTDYLTGGRYTHDRPPSSNQSMNTEKLDVRLTIESAISTPDALGDSVETWSIIGAAWANVKMVFQRDNEFSGATTSYSTHRVTIRDNKSMDLRIGTYRFTTEDGRILNFTSLPVYARGFVTVLTADNIEVYAR